jgi:hypothetical protein
MNCPVPSNRSQLLASAIGGVAVVLFLLIASLAFLALRRDDERVRQMKERQRQVWIDTQLRELRSGETDTIHFYTTEQTDDLLKVFAGMSEVRRMGFELTDVTADGMKMVAKLPNLRELVLYGGRPSVDNEGLREISGHKQIVTLKLVNTDVTDEGLAVLATLPNLRSVTLYREAFRDRTLTDKGLLSLGTLDQLEELVIDGGWASSAAVEQLQTELPNCKISLESKW